MALTQDLESFSEASSGAGLLFATLHRCHESSRRDQLSLKRVAPPDLPNASVHALRTRLDPGARVRAAGHSPRRLEQSLKAVPQELWDESVHARGTRPDPVEPDRVAENSPNFPWEM